MKNLIFTTLAFTASLLTSGSAMAFCGFYASSASAKTFNETSEVVLMRDGSATSLSMRNDYEGPLEDFALVVPVPELLQKEDVKTLPHEIFDTLETFTAPKLVDYWEADPCEYSYTGKHRVVLESGHSRLNTGVVIEAEFAVGEYDIVMLSAKHSVKLERWLTKHKYNIPKGARKALAPYIAQGMYFLVARVDPKRVTMRDGKALLSPLRFQYHSKEFSLPVRLGLLNAKGPQDLIVYLLSRNGRVEAANYPNAIIPTNLTLTAYEASDFEDFYDALFTHTLKLNPGALVTEYVWHTFQKCDPCTSSFAQTIPRGHLFTLGGDHPGASGRRIEVSLLTQPLLDEIRKNGGQEQVHMFAKRAAEQRKPLIKCYNDALARRVSISNDDFELRITTSPEGTVEKFKLHFDTKQDPKLLACLNASIKKMTFYPAKSRAKESITLHYRVGSSTATVKDYMLTRMRARFEDTSSREDIVFRATKKRLHGGVDPPDERGVMARTTYDKHNRFQARYARLHRWTEPVTCNESWPLSWYGTPREGEKTIQGTPDGEHTLSEAILKQLVVKPAEIPSDAASPSK